MHAKTLLFQPVPFGTALPPGNAASCFGGHGITWKEKRSEFLFMAVRKRKTDAYQPDKRPPEIICPVFYALQKISSSAQSA
mgnify:CR=1 FL=1